MLSFRTLDEPYAGLELVKRHLDPSSLEEFAWSLFELWSVTGDQNGQRLAQFPRKNSADDAAKAEVAEKSWKDLKTDLARVAAELIARLERAMSTRRRWSAGEFQDFFVAHPLNLARRLVGGVYDPQDELTAAFRMAEDGSFANRDDELFTLAEAQVGIVHPVELSAAELSLWRERLSDYDVMQPFAQIDRHVFRPDPTRPLAAAGGQSPLRDALQVGEKGLGERADVGSRSG